MGAGVVIISSFKMQGDVVSDHFLTLWFQKDSLDTVGFMTFRRFRGGRGQGFVDFGGPK